MLRTSRVVGQTTSLARKRLISQASSSVRGARQGRAVPAAVAATAVVAAGSLWYATHQVIHNDAVLGADNIAAALPSADVSGVSPVDGSLATVVWGSNK